MFSGSVIDVEWAIERDDVVRRALGSRGIGDVEDIITTRLGLVHQVAQMTVEGDDRVIGTCVSAPVRVPNVPIRRYWQSRWWSPC